MNPYMETAAILAGSSIALEAAILGGAVGIVKLQERYYLRRAARRYNNALLEYQSGKSAAPPKFEDFY